MNKCLNHIDIIIPVFNPGAEFYKMLLILCKQKIDPSWTYSINIVDDASSNYTHLQQVKNYCSKIKIIRHNENKGRSGARNSGVSHTSGELLIFIDADCVIDSVNSIEKHRVKLVEGGVDVNFGRVNSYGKGFWSDYFSDVSIKRDIAGKSGDYMALTSANFAITRTVFEEVDGFDEQFKKYGFEDRDFIASLLNKKIQISYSPDIVVTHNDRLSLLSICKKLEQSGRYSAHIFSLNHPDYYKKMSYRTIDVKYHPILSFPVRIMAKILPWLIQSGDKFINNKQAPFIIKKMVVVMITALSFSWGTYCSKFNIRDN